MYVCVVSKREKALLYYDSDLSTSTVVMCDLSMVVVINTMHLCKK